jgi:hypothetical protein
VSEEVGVIEPIDTLALWDCRLLVDGEEDNDKAEDGDTLLLALNVFVLVAVVSGLDVDLIVGVITAVLNAVVDSDDVIVPVTDMKEETEGVTVFCKDEVTDTEPE